MSIFSWNERKSARIAELDKLARIAELENENRELRLARDELLADNKVLEETCDELRSENKSLHNVGMGYRESAERLAKERDESKLRLDDCLTKICKLHDRAAVFESAIRTAVSIAGL